MSILIKGLKMPKSCCECFAFKTNASGMMFCRAGKTAFEKEDAEWLPLRVSDHCPIIELPDHGDLIEREYAIASACSGKIRTLPTTEDGEDWIRVKEVRQSLKSVPFVIPTERDEE